MACLVTGGGEFADLVAHLGSGAGDLTDRQLAREKAQRQAASGKRASSILRGDMGPVLRRWVSGAIVPVAGRLRALCTAQAAGDYDGAAALTASPVFGLPQLGESRDLLAVTQWALKADHAEDLVLAVLGTAISLTATSKDGQGVPLTRLLTACAGVARETALGQFLTQIQGAKAMLRVRRSGKAAWAQGKKLDSVAALMSGQVRSALDAVPLEEIPIRGKEVVSILTPAGETRRVDLRRPEPGDWKLLEVARRVKGEQDAHLATWCAFAMLVLCCAQAHSGWFDLVKMPRRHSAARTRRHRRAAHGVVLSPAAWDAIKGDLDRWLSLGFIYEPMIVPPERGDYLSVKHREVAGGRGPRGMKTNANGTAAWAIATEVMAGTAWSVPERTLEALRDAPAVRDLAARAEPDEARRDLILAGYRKLAKDTFYLPLFMDFRGRVYGRSTLVTYQGRDLQKALICFPPSHNPHIWSEQEWHAVALHVSALYGGPEKLDKATLAERSDWLVRVLKGNQAPMEMLLLQADEPLQLYTALMLIQAGEWDRIACQIDGTCNGLQHLSALFRDETAAPWVNLCGAGLDEPPRDIYAEVAKRVEAVLAASGEAWARRVRSAVRIDRKLCKKPVMVLPYGGTRTTIEDAVLEAILEQGPDSDVWCWGYIPDADKGRAWRWPDWTDGNYAAFSDRELKDHPLLHLDAKRLGGLVWDAIVEILPKPMAAMQAFRDIAKAVGERSLEWSTGFQSGDQPALWIVQAKARADATGLKFKGFHLPGSVRGLRIRAGRDEVDAHSHTTGIVANFIHSQDAAHLARTMAGFRAVSPGPPAFGAIHDCYITRPSLMGALGEATRAAFEAQYMQDPLGQPVRLRHPASPSSVPSEEFPSWYALAEAVGVTFPERGSWDPSEVRRSAWFFS